MKGIWGGGNSGRNVGRCMCCVALEWWDGALVEELEGGRCGGGIVMAVWN